MLFRFKEKGGIHQEKKISNFMDLADFDVVVNCAGIGAKWLTGDPLLEPVRGQVFKVNQKTSFEVFPS